MTDTYTADAAPISPRAGRIVDYLLARAMFAAYRGRSYRPYIALARIAARIAERRGAYAA